MNGFVKRRFLIVVCALIGSALYIMGHYGVALTHNKPGETKRPHNAAERGIILDRNGKTLAYPVTMYDISVKPPFKEDNRSLAKDIAAVLDMNEDDVLNRLNMAGKRFLIKRRVPASTKEKITEEQRNGRLDNIIIDDVPWRVYPENNLAAQIIGYMGKDEAGGGGVEHAFYQELAAGYNIVLTIDINVQRILEKVAASTLRETQAETVMFLAMDTRNGEILGSALLPNFNPNDINSADLKTLNNHAAISPYEPGSVLKIFSIAATMDSGAISEHSEFICSGVYERIINGSKVRIDCLDGHPHGRVTPRDIIVYSCNIGTALAVEQLGNQAFYDLMYQFGFGNKTGAWLNYANKSMAETAGMLKEPALWWGGSKHSIAYGQEISVSTLQIIQAASVIANNGVLVPPKIVSRIVSPDGKTITTSENNDNMSRQVIRPETAQKMLSYMMDTATEIGTGWRANVEDLHLAVKTGTSQHLRYSKTDYIASCIALLPGEYPSLALYVVITKPQGETYGGRIAAPAIREAAELLIDYLGIPRGRNSIIEHPNIIGFSEVSLPVIDTHVPDFYGISKKTLLPLLFQDNIRVEISGEGWVQRQYPPPGTVLTPDTVIELILE